MADTTLCCFPPLSLGLATMDADHLGQNVASTPLALSAVECGLQPDTSTASTLVGVEVSAQLHVKLQSLSFPKSCLPFLF